MSIAYRAGTIGEVLKVNAMVPEFEQAHSEETLSARIANKASLILLAEVDDVCAGYKLAYQRSPEELYSWLGAVAPAYRKMGIARALLEQQERWALENGFARISVKSMNRFPAMLHLLISSGYDVSGYEDEGDPTTSKILFTKWLST